MLKGAEKYGVETQDQQIRFGQGVANSRCRYGKLYRSLLTELFIF